MATLPLTLALIAMLALVHGGIALLFSKMGANIFAKGK